MDATVTDFSRRLKEIAKDLSFLARPRYPLAHLIQLFPQYKYFIHQLEDISTPFGVDGASKRFLMDQFLADLDQSNLSNELKEIFNRRVDDYRSLLLMMENFGGSIFYENCLKLYGTSKQSMKDPHFHQFIDKISEHCEIDEMGEMYSGEKAMSYIKNKLSESFPDTDIEVKPSSSLLSDSSAGRKVFKLNPHKEYSLQQLNIFLAHEGWAHLGTSLNGFLQVDHPWLSVWSPRTTFLQEGLAILTELITGFMTKERWHKIQLRHLATAMAEEGSQIKDVYGFLRHHGVSGLDALKLALRVFRGVPLEGGMAFTKELLYLHGVIQLLYQLEYFQADLKTFWIGKVSFEEHALLINDWPKLQQHLAYYPRQLEEVAVKERLINLQKLASSLFTRAYL